MIRQSLLLPALLALVLPLAVTADEGPHTPQPMPSAALFEATSHRKFDQVEQWTKVFDDPARDAWQRPAAVVEALQIAPGTVVADIGAGTGYFSPHLSGAVGPMGTVLAVETEPNMVAHLRLRAERENSANIVPILASFDNPRLPPGRVDLVLFVDTLHHIDARLAYLRRLQGALTPTGRVAVIDWLKRDIPVGPKRDHKLPRRQVIAEMEAAGYRLLDEPDLLPYQYFLVFARK